MAYTTINKGADYFNTVLYTGTGATHNITGVGFQPDWVWIKHRNNPTAYNHRLYDSVRGATKNIASNETDAEITSSTELTSFDSDGFTLGSGNPANQNTINHVAWNWLAGTTASGSTSGSGTAKTYNSSTSTTAGFSIVKYVGNGTANHQFPHGLGVKPDMVFIKNLDDGTTNWQGYNKDLTATKSFKLNSTDAPATTASVTNNVEPTTTVFNLGSGADANANNQEHIAYLFAEKQGYSKIGQYTGNGNADGPFVYTGFKPAWIMINNINQADDWYMFDNKRSSFNQVQANLKPNTTSAEASSTSYAFDFLSNGFKLRAATGAVNNNTDTLMYMAFAEHPFVSSTGTPVTAR